MIHDYTDNTIIQFIYNECDLFDKLEMEFAMEEDSTLLEDYHELLLAKRILPDVLFSPKKSSVANILAYAACD